MKLVPGTSSYGTHDSKRDYPSIPTQDREVATQIPWVHFQLCVIQIMDENGNRCNKYSPSLLFFVFCFAESHRILGPLKNMRFCIP